MNEREQIQAAILDAMEALTGAVAEQQVAGRVYAEADHAYRQKQAAEYVKASVMKREDGKLLTEDHRAALVDLACSDEMLACRLAEARRESAKIRVDSLRAQLSAGQSLLSAERAEANALRYGQTVGA